MDVSKSVESSSLLKNVNARPHNNIERIQNIFLIWLDNNINDDCCNTIKQLKHILDNINTFTNDDQCVQFIQTITDSKICMIISDVFAQQVVPRVHDISQIDTILIFNTKNQWDEGLTRKWPKIKGVFTELLSISEALKQSVQKCEQNIIPISFIPSNIADQSNTIFDRVDSFFIYIQVIKEVLLTVDFGEMHFEKFIDYCREVFAKDDKELEYINQLNRDYYSKRPIWWYTQKSFLYRMLNRALRSSNAGIIVRMGFFIDDLHRDIQRLHVDKSFTVYRGQGLSKKNFEQMNNIKGGFISFNDFLLTSMNRQVSLDFAQQVAINPDLVGILFVMNIDATQSTTSFASISDVSYFQIEDEVLFSMQTIFRIDDIKSLDGTNHIYEVTLTLTNDNEKDLRKLNDRIREETFPEQKGWFRFGQLLLKMKYFQKAEEVYEVLLSQTTKESDNMPIYHQLGWIKNHQKDYRAALILYEKSLDIGQQTLSSKHINLASTHTHIGATHYNMGIYPKALSSYEKALEIRQKSLSSNDLDLVSSYQDIGMVYNSMNDYPEALSFYEQALQIQQQALPPNHPDLIASYNNIGITHYNMGNYSKAISSNDKAFRIQQQSLPPNHPDLAVYYNNIGMVYNNTGDYPNALSSYEKALQILQQNHPENHPNLVPPYNNVGMVYCSMGDYSKALLSYEKVLQIREQSLPPNHPDLGDSYHNIGMVHYSMSNYPKALSFYEKSLEIKQKSLSSNHPSLGTSYNNIGMVYINMGDYSKALSSHQNALQIRQQSLAPNHPDLAMSFGYIGHVYNNMGEHLKALSYCQRAVDMAQQSLHSNHPHFQWYMNLLQDVEKKL